MSISNTAFRCFLRQQYIMDDEYDAPVRNAVTVQETENGIHTTGRKGGKKGNTVEPRQSEISVNPNRM
jgi:hypothetical protein